MIANDLNTIRVHLESVCVTVRAVGVNVSCMFARVFYLFHVVLYIQDSQWPRDSVL